MFLNVVIFQWFLALVWEWEEEEEEKGKKAEILMVGYARVGPSTNPFLPPSLSLFFITLASGAEH